MHVFNIQSLNIYSVTSNHFVIKILYESVFLTKYVQYILDMRYTITIYCIYEFIRGFNFHASSPLATR